MEYRVVGIRRNMEFDTKDGGKMSGAKVFMTCKDDRVDGCMTDSFFISTESKCYANVAALRPDTDVEVYFNRYGKVDAIVALN